MYIQEQLKIQQSSSILFAICITKQKDMAQHLVPSFECDFSASHS